MHRGYRFDVRRRAARRAPTRCGSRFDSAYEYAEAHGASGSGARPAAYHEPFNFIRKMACNFGWDWGPTLVTAGIWQADRPALVVGGPARRGPSTGDGGAGRSGHVAVSTVAVEVHGRLDGTGARLDRRADRPRWAGTGTGSGRGRRARPCCGLHRPDAGAVVAPRLRRASPLRRWPSPSPPADGTELDAVGALDRLPRRAARHQRRRARHGLHPGRQRRAGLRPRGATGSRTTPFPTRITRERLAAPARPGGRRERQPAAGLGRRPVRVGGLLRPRRRAGPAGRPGLPVRLRGLPGGGAVRRARSRPRRASRWSGSRPIPAWSRGPATTRTSGATPTGTGRSRWPGGPGAPATTSTCCPRIVAELDPTRPYWPGSPYSGRPRPAPQRPGPRHHAHLGRLEHRRLHALPRLPPAVRRRVRLPGAADLRDAAPGHLTTSRSPRDSPGMRAPPEGGRRRPQAAPAGWPPTCPTPRDFDDWHYLTQLNQARAHPARGRALPVAAPACCMGAIVWQLNDCWPVTSWAAVDGDGRRKPLWYALRRAYADRLLTVQPAADGLALAAVNDSPHRWTGSGGRHPGRPWTAQPRAKTTVDVDVPPRAVTTLALPADLATPERRRAARCWSSTSRPMAGGPGGSSPRTRTSPTRRRRSTRWSTPVAGRPAGHGDRPHPAARPVPVPGPARPGGHSGRHAGHAAAGRVGASSRVRAARPARPGRADQSTGPALRERPDRRVRDGDRARRRHRRAPSSRPRSSMPAGGVHARATVATPVAADPAVVAAALEQAGRTRSYRPTRRARSARPASRSAGPVDPTAGTVSPVNIPAWRGFDIVAAVGARSRPAGDPRRRWSRHGAGRVLAWRAAGGRCSAWSCRPGSAAASSSTDGSTPARPATPATSDTSWSTSTGRSCPCGGRGCVEVYASGPAMVAVGPFLRLGPLRPPTAAACAHDAPAGCTRSRWPPSGAEPTPWPPPSCPRPRWSTSTRS